MNIETAGTLLAENLRTIFAWSFSRVYNKQEAEDLSQDIICAVLRSIPHLKNDDAFYGFLWKTAENTLRARLRKFQPTAAYEEEFRGACWTTPEENLIQSDQLRLLRRELTLLSDQYREVTVRYYIQGKRCAQIAQELQISQEMVKYYLFKTRKILKEGIGMTREYGEKSYNPQTFRMDFWGGGDNSIYWSIFKRRLPGNILLSAYPKPLTISELSIELGVAAPYLEDELKILLEHDLLRQTGDKFQTNIIIFTDEYEKHAYPQFEPLCTLTASRISLLLDQAMPQLKALSFHNVARNDNELKWIFANIAMYHALRIADLSGIRQYGSYPPLSNGSNGFIYGYDNDYLHHHYHGIDGYYENEEKTAWVSIENYRILENCQRCNTYNWDSFTALNDAVLERTPNPDNDEIIRYIEEGFIQVKDGKLWANFPTFSEEVFSTIQVILQPVITDAADCMETVCALAANILRDYTPKALLDKCGQLSHIRHQMDVMAYLLEAMVMEGSLAIPKEKANLCMFGVKMQPPSTNN